MTSFYFCDLHSSSFYLGQAIGPVLYAFGFAHAGVEPFARGLLDRARSAGSHPAVLRPPRPCCRRGGHLQCVANPLVARLAVLQDLERPAGGGDVGRGLGRIDGEAAQFHLELLVKRL